MKIWKDERFLPIVEEIMESGQYTNSSLEGGKYVQLFEKSLTDYLGKPTVVVNSGTTALIMSLWLAGVRAYDNVVIPAYSFKATESAVKALQAEPVYADIKEDYTIDWDMVALLANDDTTAIVTVDLYGNIADIDDFEIPVVEDACQALGTIKEIRADYTCFSFYPTKIVNCMEGGAITVHNEEEAQRVRKLRTYPDGLNFRMGEINAAMGWLQMQDFKGGRPEGWFKPYDYTLSPPGMCPVADSKKV